VHLNRNLSQAKWKISDDEQDFDVDRESIDGQARLNFQQSVAAEPLQSTLRVPDVELKERAHDRVEHEPNQMASVQEAEHAHGHRIAGQLIAPVGD